MKSDHWESWVCLALTYEKLGQHHEADAQIPRLVQLNGDAFAYQFVQIYAQWGKPGKALDWLEKAARDHDGIYSTFFNVDPYLDPLRGDPRFEALVSAILSGSVK